MDKEMVINNLLLSYGEINSEEKTTVIFLHGWRSQKEVWENVISILSKERVRIISLDLPGFGKSSSPKTELTISDYANIVGEFLKKKDANVIFLVGHSFGGRVGIKLAYQYPELITKLVLVNSAGFKSQNKKVKFYKKISKIVKPLFKPKFMRGLRKKIYKKIGAEDYIATPDMKKTFISTINEDLTENMKKLACPTLIICGEKDSETPPQDGEKMNMLIKNSKMLMIKNAGHFSFIDDTSTFLKELNKFIKK